jgi:ABC-2 type transport system permease protein
VLLGWRPAGAPWAAVLLVLVVGTAAFSGLALLMAGTLRAEATLAGANLLYLLLLLGGGIVVPLTKFPAAMQAVLGWLPSAALATALRAALADGAVLWGSIGILTVWAMVALAAAARWFRWE